MPPLGWVACVVAGSWAAAGLYYPCLVPSRRARLGAVAALSPVLLALPLLVPDALAGARLVRFVLAVQAAAFISRMLDLDRGYALHGRPPLPAFAAFMLLPYHFVLRTVGDEQGRGRRGEALRLVRGLVEIALGLLLARGAFALALGETSFWLDHCVKLLAAYPVLDGACIALVSLMRVLGGRARDIYRDPIAARTPADFWRRYNRVYGEFLKEDVYRPLAARLHPAAAGLLTFLASGIMHEYVFGVAIGRVQGYQLAFFLLQGVGAVATMGWRPRGARAIVGVGLTLAFNLGTLVFFCASFDHVLRGAWYAGGGLLP